MSGRSPTLTERRPPRPAPGTSRIDPRIRQRRAEVLRAKARRRLRVVLVVSALLAIGFGAWAILHTRLLSARVVTVAGAVHTPVADVVRAAGLAEHPPLIDVSPSASAAAVERLPWVARATVTRQWPDGVRITVTERTPAMAVSTSATPAGGRWVLVDRTGRVLQATTTVPTGLVLVVAPHAPGPAGTSLAGDGPALQVTRALPPAFRAQVVEVAEAGPDELTLHLTSPVTVDLGSTVDLHQKFEDVAAVLAGAPLRAGEVIDVAAPGEPVIST